MKRSNSGRWHAMAATAAVVAVLGASGCVGPSSLASPAEQTPQRDCPPGMLIGAGSTAQQGVIDAAIASYGVACRGGNQITYDGKGSGDGVTNFVNGLTHFAGSDAPLTEEEATRAEVRCGGAPAWHLPMVIGPIALAYNLEGVTDLNLDAETTARIFSGEIDRWNDQAIIELNPRASLPDEPITVVHRSDSSGTTQNFTTWLQAAAPESWSPEQVSNNWKGSGEGAAKSDGVATTVNETPGAITYVETSYADDYSLPVAGLQTSEGWSVRPDTESVAAALEGAQTDGEAGDLQLELDPVPGNPAAYPIVQITYEIVCSEGLDPERTALLKDFLTYFADPQTQQMLADRGYFPLPADISEQLPPLIEQIR